MLHARILWTLSTAYARWPDAAVADAAEAAFRFIADRIVDRRQGGVFRTVAPTGEPANANKHLYAQAFAIYGLAAYHAASGAPEAKVLAMQIADVIVRQAADPELLAAFSRPSLGLDARSEHPDGTRRRGQDVQRPLPSA